MLFPDAISKPFIANLVVSSSSVIPGPKVTRQTELLLPHYEEALQSIYS